MTRECPAFMCPLKDHTDCWRDYAQQEEQDKYHAEPPC